MNTQSDSQNELSRILEKIQEIIEKSADGDYIYRGEPEQYKEKPYDGKVSSNLYREYLEVEAEHFDITVVQKEILDNAREYIGEAVRDFEILTELQHRGGNTNLIDFTTDYLIALFFACDGSQNKPGRVILLKKESERYKVEKASKTINRAESQKSIFVQSDTGFIGPEQYKVVCIQDDLKTYMLDYLQKHHDISTRTIYNDLQGFIENRRIHRSAYTEFYRGLTCQERGNVAETDKEKHDHYESAVKCYTEALKLNPQMFVAYHNRGIVYSDKGEYDAALQDFSTAIENNPDYTKAYYNRGVAYQRKGEYDAALQDFSRAIKLDLDYADAYYCRGLIYIIKNEYDAALQDFSTAIKSKPDYAEAYHNRGIIYSDKGEYDAALQDFSKAIEINSDDANAYRSRGIVYSDKGEYDAALQDFSKAIEMNPDEADAYYDDRGVVYLRKGEYDAALQDFSKAIEMNPDEAKPYYSRGLTYIIKNEYDKATQDFSKAIELDPDNAKTYVYRGGIYHITGEYDKATQDFSKAIELDPDNSEAYCDRGEAWLHLKEWEKARTDLNLAKDRGVDVIASFHNDYESVKDFEEKNNLQLPKDIAAMLRRQ